MLHTKHESGPSDVVTSHDGRVEAPYSLPVTSPPGYSKIEIFRLDSVGKRAVIENIR